MRPHPPGSATAEEDWATATGDLYTKFREDRSSGSRDMLADRQTNTQTDRHTDCNTPLPYRGRVIISSVMHQNSSTAFPQELSGGAALRQGEEKLLCMHPLAKNYGSGCRDAHAWLRSQICPLALLITISLCFNQSTTTRMFQGWCHTFQHRF